MNNVLCFDLDGPLLDVSERYYRYYFDFVIKNGGHPLPKQHYWDSKRNLISEKDILRQSGICEKTSEYSANRRIMIENPTYLRFDAVWPGLPAALSALQTDYIMLLVTLRHSGKALHWELDYLGLESFFQYVLSANADGIVEERANVKVSLVRQALGTDPLTGWFVGDTETDIRAGQALNVNTVAVTFGIRTADQLARYQPDVLLNKPEKLVAWLKDPESERQLVRKPNDSIG